jgi:Family of unknown function (DUF5681)
VTDISHAENSAKRRRGNPDKIKQFQFQRGRSGNPGGRPKGLVSDATREWLSQIDSKTGKTNAELIALAQGKKALKGETGAYCAMRDTTEGRPAQTQQHELVSHSPVKVAIDVDLLGALRQIYGLGSSPAQVETNIGTEPNGTLPTEGINPC